jgi:hypothetical protein
LSSSNSSKKRELLDRIGSISLSKGQAETKKNPANIIVCPPKDLIQSMHTFQTFPRLRNIRRREKTHKRDNRRFRPTPLVSQTTTGFKPRSSISSSRRNKEKQSKAKVRKKRRSENCRLTEESKNIIKLRKIAMACTFSMAPFSTSVTQSKWWLTTQKEVCNNRRNNNLLTNTRLMLISFLNICETASQRGRPPSL